MNADSMTSSTEQTETITESAPMETSVDTAPIQTEDKPVNNVTEEEQQQTETENETKAGKRKRSTKKVVTEPVENIANGRPKRNLSKREDNPSELVNGTPKASRTKVEQSNQEEEEEEGAEDEQEREINIPVAHDVADVVWVKMGGHPWWPSLVIRDPNDSNNSFTKVSGNARPKRLYFVVFYGSTADFAWVADSAVIPYQGVEAFTQYAQEAVDKAVTKHQKEQLTERFQLKVTIGRREDWETAVREADEAVKQTSEKRLEDIGPKIQFYTNKFVTSKAQTGGRRTKNSVTKPDEVTRPVPPVQSEQSKYLSTLDPADRSLLAEKTFEFKSDDEDSAHEAPPPLRQTPTVKIKLNKQPSNDSDSNTTPPTKRRLLSKPNTVFGQTANGSSVSYEQVPVTETTPVKPDSDNHVNGSNSGKKRGRPRVHQPSASSSNEDSPAQPAEFTSVTPTVTTKFTTQRKPIIKPQAFMNSSNGQHDIRTGFLSSVDEQELLDILDQLGPLKTFEEAELKAKRRFEHILCLNLNRTHVDIPQEWFYTFLFSHPSLIIKNPQWFTDKNSSNETELLTDVQSANSLAVLKHQLVVLSKLYRNQLQTRSATTTTTSSKKRQSIGKNKQNEDEELLN